MGLLQQVDYAIRCTIYLCGTRGRLATKTEVARAVRAPDLFVAKILQRLVRAGIVLSVRGVRGGFVLARDPSTLSLLDVVEVTQAPLAPRPCVINPRACPLLKKCPVHPVWVRVYQKTVRELSRVRFSSLARASKGMFGSPLRESKPRRAVRVSHGQRQGARTARRASAAETRSGFRLSDGLD